jgi:hypothetical protein
LVLLLGSLTVLRAEGQITAGNIENMSGWLTCATCAGKAGSTAAAPHSMTQGISSPALDGSSAKFWLGGSTPYSDVIWWKRLGGSQASHFVYDLYFYLKQPSAPQALEFDVNDSINNQWYVFGTECNYRQYGQWRVWDTAGKRWMLTGITCPAAQAYKWNHVIWEFQRINGMAKFISFTFNGVKHYVNRSYYPKSNPNGYQTSVAFQMDGNYKQQDYSVWLDKVSLRSW